MNSQTTLESGFSFAQFDFNSTADSSTTGRDLSDFGANWPEPIRGGIKTLPALQITDGPNPGQVGGDKYHRKFSRDGDARQDQGQSLYAPRRRDPGSGLSRLDMVSDSDFRFLGRFTNQGNNVTARFPNELFARSFADYMTGWTEFLAARGPRNNSLPVWDAWLRAGSVAGEPEAHPELRSPLRNLGCIPREKRTGGRIRRGTQVRSFPEAPLHMAFEGDKGIPPGFISRIGTTLHRAWGSLTTRSATTAWVLRAGYGMYYAFPGALIRTNATDEFPVSPRLQGFEARLGNPWLTSVAEVDDPPGSVPGQRTRLGAGSRFPAAISRMISYASNFSTPMSHQWNITAEREIHSGVTAAIGYVANVSRNLLQTIPFDYGVFKNLPDGTPPSASAANINARSRSRITVPRRCELRPRALSTITRFKPLPISGRATSMAASPTSTRMTSATAAGRALLYRMKTRTASRRRPTTRPIHERIRSPLAHSHSPRLHTQVPFLRNNVGWAGRLLGRWQISGSTTFNSGQPINVILGYDANFDGITTSHQDRPDLVAPISYTEGSTADKMQRYFDPASFKAPVITAQNTFGNLPRNALFAPGTWNSSLVLIKSFEVRNGMRAFRVEAYNWLNNANLDAR